MEIGQKNNAQGNEHNDLTPSSFDVNMSLEYFEHKNDVLKFLSC